MKLHIYILKKIYIRIQKSLSLPVVFYAIIGVAFFSCKPYTQITYTNEQIRLTDHMAPDSDAIKLIAPYKDSLGEEINQVIGILATDITKEKPESGLTNLVADVLLKEGRNIFADTIDFAVYNYGGVRLQSLNAGPITREKIFELLPFENFATIITLDAATTGRFIQKISYEDGWPVAGISFQIENHKAIHILINDEPFDSTSTKTYNIIMNDYMANGGDKLDFLPGNKMTVLGITVRDMMMNYFIKQQAAGYKVFSAKDGRITYAQ